jgi:hypothetical protein
VGTGSIACYRYIFFFGDNTEIVLFNIVIELYDGKLGVI